MTTDKHGSANNLPAETEFLLYRTEDGRVRIETRMQNETVWLTINQMSALFGVDKSGISRHLTNIFETGELARDSVVAIFATTAADGKIYQMEHYNLDAIISVGYRVNSIRGTQFRIWATQRLREYIIKGFAMDDERLAEPGGIDYFDELLERIRAIRASEKRFYQKVRDIYMLSYDYDPNHPLTQEFFATVQNKMLYAATGMTAAELISSRAKAELPNMGLTTWKGAGHGRVLTKTDIGIAKNYLNRQEVSMLELLVGQYLDLAEVHARQRKVMTMKDWIEKLDAFLKLNNQEILAQAGNMSADAARQVADAEYEKFSANRRLIDADHADEELKEKVRQLAEGKKESGA